MIFSRILQRGPGRLSRIVMMFLIGTSAISTARMMTRSAVTHSFHRHVLSYCIIVVIRLIGCLVVIGVFSNASVTASVCPNV